MEEERFYRIEAIDGRVKYPVCHTIIDSEDYDYYEFIEVDGSYCGDIFSVTVRCSKCGAILEVF